MVLIQDECDAYIYNYKACEDGIDRILAFQIHNTGYCFPLVFNCPYSGLTCGTQVIGGQTYQTCYCACP